MLAVRDVHAFYGASHVLQGVSLDVEAGRIVSLLGRNGTGKTTTLRTIMGVVRAHGGEIRFMEEAIHGQPSYRIARRGVQLVPEERAIFPRLTVEENLNVGAVASGMSRDAQANRERVFKYFPVLRERRLQLGQSLSGGEQQQLAIGRALMTNPRLLMLDEPCEGLAPRIVEVLLEAIREIQRDGTTILLVEQNVHAALRLADRHYVMAKGVVVGAFTSQELREDEQLRIKYLGVSAQL
jgi:branched-chain amino acid transport system ATP-binding protein